MNNFRIDIVASGSKGNAYSIQDGKSRILIDPGISFKSLQKKLNFTLADHEFALVSHEHKDHCAAVPNLWRLGVVCYMSTGTMEKTENYNGFCIEIEANEKFSHGEWVVLPFEVCHDAAEPLGFLIKSPSGKKICYATDTCRINHRFKGVSHWMIEANYSEDYLARNEILTESIKNRIRDSHFELSKVKNFFKNQDLTKTERIYLIHLSESNADSDFFVSEIAKITGKPVYLD